MVNEIGKKLNITSKEGYKVVAMNVRTKQYYSLAMGFRYRKGNVPKRKIHQQRISYHFNEYILPKSIIEYEKYVCNDDRTNGFRKFYLGKTAFFEELSAARYYYSIINDTIDGYTTVIVKATFSGDIYEAEGDSNRIKVFLATKIDSMKKVRGEL